MRNKRRSFITLLAIIFGCISLILYGGFIDYSFWGLRESTIHASLGHLQIYREGFSKGKGASTFAYSIDTNTYKKIERILKLEEEILIYTPRLDLIGLISNGEHTLNFVGNGINPEKESDLSSYFIELVHGYNLEHGDTDAAILAKGLADGLGAKIGDYLTLVTSTIDGAFNAIDIQVKGIFSTGNKEYDSRALMLPISTAKDLLYTQDIHKMVVLLEETEETESVVSSLRQEFKKHNLKLEIKTWSDLATFYHKVVKMYSTTFNFIKGIIAIIVILSISNTMTMTVLERTTEIGTIMALGTKRRTVLNLFLLEGLYLGVLGSILGLIFGVITSKVINFFGGISISPPPGSTRGYVIFINIVSHVMIYAFITSTLSALISSIIPAYKASRLRIVDALRYV